jgi:integrase
MFSPIPGPGNGFNAVAGSIAGTGSRPKKGNARDPRNRIVIIPERTIRALRWWLLLAPEEGPIFQYCGRPIRGDYLLDRFLMGCRRAEIDVEKRRIRIHSLRYTYNTRMETILPGDRLRDFLGHRSEAIRCECKKNKEKC